MPTAHPVCRVLPRSEPPRCSARSRTSPHLPPLRLCTHYACRVSVSRHAPDTLLLDALGLVRHTEGVERADLIRLRRVRDLIDREYAEPLDVPRLAREALMSVGHFQRSFREAFGETPHAWLMTRRIERAMTLFRNTEMSVTEVCMAVGATSLGSFSSRFTELVGETPSAYRARPHDELRGVPGCIAKQATRPRRR
jgi:AraC-like DNA-binding protein